MVTRWEIDYEYIFGKGNTPEDKRIKDLKDRFIYNPGIEIINLLTE